MAETYRAVATGVAYASGKSMLGIFNGASSTKIVRIYRCWVLNNGLTAVTGVLTTFQIRLSTNQSGGTTISVVKHDANNANLDANILIATGATVTDGSLLRQFIYSNDEPGVSGATQDEWELLIPLNCVWDSGYGDTNVQPITLRPGNSTHAGFHIKHSGTTAVGSCDLEIEFTQETS